MHLWRTSGLDSLRRDVRDAWRSLQRRPLPSTAAIVTIAIGAGLNAAVFTVVVLVGVAPAFRASRIAHRSSRQSRRRRSGLRIRAVAAPVLLAVVGLVAASLAAARVLRADPAATLRRD